MDIKTIAKTISLIENNSVQKKTILAKKTHKHKNHTQQKLTKYTHRQKQLKQYTAKTTKHTLSVVFQCMFQCMFSF